MQRDTEFIAEVVRIASVRPHPNADKLELAEFDTLDGPAAYKCVIKKGQFAVGDQAGYVGVDSTVPLVGPGSERWDFLKTRLDAKDRPRYRIRAAKLRGVYSEGILMEVDEHLVLGDPLAEAWDIAYYQTPEVPGPTAAGSQTGPVKVKDHTLGGRFPIYGVDSLRKVPWLFADGDEVVYTEKIHGTNFRAGLLGIGLFGSQRFVLGSHRVVKSTGKGFWGRLWDRLTGRAPGAGWYGEDVWGDAATQLDLERRMRRLGLKNVVLYGELYGRTKGGAKIQDLTYGDPVLGLRLFDAYDVETQSYYSWPDLRALATKLELEVVPVIEGGYHSMERTREYAEGVSTLDGVTQREGVVVRATHDNRRGKYVGEGYRMREGA